MLLVFCVSCDVLFYFSVSCYAHVPLSASRSPFPFRRPVSAVVLLISFSCFSLVLCVLVYCSYLGFWLVPFFCFCFRVPFLFPVVSFFYRVSYFVFAFRARYVRVCARCFLFTFRVASCSCYCLFYSFPFLLCSARLVSLLYTAVSRRLFFSLSVLLFILSVFRFFSFPFVHGLFSPACRVASFSDMLCYAPLASWLFVSFLSCSFPSY